jgi:hypothetical protein
MSVRQEKSVDQDRRRRHRAARSLDIALSMHCNGSFATLAWLAAGRPSSGVGQSEIAAFQQARRIVHDNGGKLKAGDVGRLLERLERGRR